MLPFPPPWRFVALLALSLSMLGAQSPAPPSLEAFEALRVRAVGPATMSGRVAALAVSPSDARRLYAGASTGGMWRSDDAGVRWRPIFDDGPCASIGAVAVHARQPDAIWIGTGEANPRNSTSVGCGVFRSLDGGNSWENLGLEQSERIARLILDPRDPQVAWVAALGPTWGESVHRGVYKTTDGGRHWTKSLYQNPSTGCADLVMDPRDPDKLFAAMWDHRRQPHTFRSGGPGSGVWMTRNGGTTWHRLGEDEGFPERPLGRIGLAIAPSAPDTVYALVEAERNVLLRSDDGGRSFARINSEPGINPRPFYYADIHVCPADPRRVYRLGTTVDLSEDGGESFRTFVGWEVHPDHHAIWFSDDGQHLWLGNDGGLAESRDRGETWRFVRNLPLAQFYHLSVDLDEPYNILGGLQDNGSWRGPSDVFENGGIRNAHWQEVCFGDGFNTLADPELSTRGYAMSQQGYLVRWNVLTGEKKAIRPGGPADTPLRFSWNAALAQDPFEAGTIWFGSQFVHRSRDRGDTWEIVSGDLTSDKEEWQQQRESGGLTRDVTGAENFCTLVCIAPSPIDQKVVWASSDDGRLHVSRDDARTWTSVEENIPGVPANTWIPHVEPSKFRAGAAFIVLDDHRRSNMTPYAFATDDFGATWRPLAPEQLRGYCLSIEQDPVQEELLFLGTEFGLWVSPDGGSNWHAWRRDLPPAGVRSLVVHPREHDLIVGTHGRGAYVIEDIAPLRAWSAELGDTPLHLFPPRLATDRRIRQSRGSRFPAEGEFRAPTPRRGARLDLWIGKAEEPPSAAEEESGAADAQTEEDAAPEPPAEASEDPLEAGKLRIDISEENGQRVVRLERDAKPGLMRIFWNLRADGGPRPGRDRPAAGPLTLPGRYSVVVTYGEHRSEGQLLVRGDPREEVSLEDRAAKHALIVKGQAALTRQVWMLHRLGRAEAALQRRNADFKAWKEAQTEAPSTGSDEDELPAEMKRVREALEAIEEAMRGADSDIQGIVRSDTITRAVGSAVGSLSSSRDAPTPAQRIALQRATARLGEQLKALDELFAGPWIKLSEQLESRGLGRLPVPAGAPKQD